MPVKPDSRFAQQPLLRVLSTDGTPQVAVALPLTASSRGDGSGVATYRVSQRDTVESIANKVLGDESQWWRILDANPVFYPMDLKPGDVLNLPAPGPATRAIRSRTF